MEDVHYVVLMAAVLLIGAFFQLYYEIYIHGVFVLLGMLGIILMEFKRWNDMVDNDWESE